MPTDRQLEQTISRWLEHEAPPQLPDRVLLATFELTRQTRQQKAWRAFLRRIQLNRMLSALAGAAVVVAAAVLALGIYANRPGLGGSAPLATPPVTFAGSWRATDPYDGSQQTMAIVGLADGTYEVTIRDDAASVCLGTPSTMTGVAEAGAPGTIVIDQPEYTCDDGSAPEIHDGPPIEEQLRAFTFTYDAERDALADSLGGAWSRLTPTATEAPAAPSPNPK
jgi:hypothetical protein